MKWIDAHVHFFGKDDEGTPPYAPANQNHTATLYAQKHGAYAPAGIVTVDFSRAPDATHVVRSIAELKQLGIPAKGIVRGNPEDERTFDWVHREDVSGIRLYAVANCPDLSKNRAAYHRLFNLLRHHDKQICIYGAGAFLHGLIKQLPEDITLLIDHLAMGDATKGANDADFQKTLAILEARRNRGQKIFFKGPGYRSGGTPKQVSVHLKEIVERFGKESVLLAASDAPFLGYADVMDYEPVGQFLHGVLREACTACDGDVAEWMTLMLYENAKKLYGF